jgi:His/Glu/Gln/Arg/opine family amino acid ABC transporter permease subunit
MDFDFVIKAMPSVLAVIPKTLAMAAVSALAGWILGLVIALTRRARTPVLSQIFAVFVSFMRSVPMIVVLYMSYYAFPAFLWSVSQKTGWQIDARAVPAIMYAILAFALEQAAYSSELFRSAIGAVDSGQLEAAYSVGMTRFRGLTRIVFPQAFVTAFPNLGGMFVGLIQGTALAYYVGVTELMATTTLLAIPSYSYMEAFLILTVVYEALSFVFNKLFHFGENRLKRYRTEGNASAKRRNRKEDVSG